jgi:hypothetical protein
MGLVAVSAAVEVGIPAPVRDFRLPRFDDAGMRLWELRGAEGVRRGDGTVDLRDMWLRFFDVSAPRATTAAAPLIEVRSPAARVYEREQRAEGTEAIEIRGPSYTITGASWSFQGSGGEQRITIREQVRVVFNEKLQTILK